MSWFQQFVTGELVLLTIWLLAQVVSLGLFRRELSKPVVAPLTDDECPKFCVGMTLRGADPFLGDAIAALLRLDYPRFEVHLIIDSAVDPAWDVAKETVARCGATNARLDTLQERPATCSLYNAAIAQFLDRLPPDCELIALCDGDTIVPKDWLRQMAAAMRDPKVGSTLGIHWYAPISAGWGSVVRYIWRAGAVVPMWMWNMLWTGTMALRKADVQQGGFSEILRHSLVEDAQVATLVQKLGKRVAFLPNLVMVNHEEITLARCFLYLRRQLLWVRLYHSAWNLVLINALTNTVAMGAPFLIAAVAFVCGETLAGLMALAGGAIYYAGLFVMLRVLENGVLGKLPQPERAECRPSTAASMVSFLGICIAQTLYVVAVMSILWVRRINWRGVSYTIRSPWNVTMNEYQPYQPAPSSPSPKSSL